jgi:site-specific DNA-methyltransferase (adenine-specific)
VPPSKEIFTEIFRISKNQIIFGGNYFIEYLKNGPCWLVWDKDNSGNFADCELAWTSFDTAVRKFTWRWNGMLQQDMKHKEKRYHPTQKPIPLFEQILRMYSKPTDLILDPFLGSGTTAIACEQLGRKWIGIEKEPKYCEIARERIKQADKTSLLFVM